MDNFSQLVMNAFDYFDTNKEKYEGLSKKFKYYRPEYYDNDVDQNYIHFFDKSQKEIFKSKYAIIGQYFISSKTWIWAWAVPKLSKKETIFARKILNYGFDLTSENITLKTALITSRFRITNLVQLEFYLALSSYLAKMPFVYGITLESWDTETQLGKLGTKSADTNNITEYYFLYD